MNHVDASPARGPALSPQAKWNILGAAHFVNDLYANYKDQKSSIYHLISIDSYHNFFLVCHKKLKFSSHLNH